MGLLDDHNPYPSIPEQVATKPMPGAAAVIALAFSVLWVFGIGSIVGVAAGVYARLHSEPGEWPRAVALVAIALGVVGIALAFWIAVSG